jgi:hypothetical protein
MDRFVILPCMKIDWICYCWWERHTTYSIELFGLQMSLVLFLDRASSRFRLKHGQPGPEIRLDHLRSESNLLDLLIYLVEEPVGGTGSESDTQIAEEKGSHL